MEDGEIPESSGFYDPSLEWPGSEGTEALELSHDDATGSEKVPRSSNHTFLRLIVQTTSVLSRRRNIAIADGFTELQFGRDAPLQGSTTPRVRLKEMEVSKIHATIFWDGLRKEWSIVDMGSKHGTFVLTSGASDASKTRLSAPRMSSIPRRISHGDVISIGSTTFTVHIHREQIPCAVCSASSTSAEIPLFSSSSATIPVAPLPVSMTNPKAALTSLKRSLLVQHSDIGPSNSSNEYVDRSAKRRAINPGSRIDSPGVTIPLNTTLERNYSSATSAGVLAPLPPTHVKTTEEALPQTNLGHRLLMKQGWKPGETLGPVTDNAEISEDQHGRLRLVEPIKVSAGPSRAGLGMPPQAEGDADVATRMGGSESWKEVSKKRRWDNANR